MLLHCSCTCCAAGLWMCQSRALLFSELGWDTGQPSLLGHLLGLCAQLRSLELAQWEGRHTGTKYWFFFLLKCEIGISIPLYINKNKSQTNKIVLIEILLSFVRVFWVYFNLQRFSFVLLSSALMPFLLPLQELVLLIFSVGRWAVVSVVNSKGQSTWKRQVCDQAASPWSLCLPQGAQSHCSLLILCLSQICRLE